MYLSAVCSHENRVACVSVYSTHNAEPSQAVKSTCACWIVNLIHSHWIMYLWDRNRLEVGIPEIMTEAIFDTFFINILETSVFYVSYSGTACLMGSQLFNLIKSRVLRLLKWCTTLFFLSLGWTLFTIVLFRYFCLVAMQKYNFNCCKKHFTHHKN